MAENDGVLDVELVERTTNECRLRAGASDPVTGAITVSGAWAVKCDNPILIGQLIEEPADHKVFSHHAIAV